MLPNVQDNIKNKTSAKQIKTVVFGIVFIVFGVLAAISVAVQFNKDVRVTPVLALTVKPNIVVIMTDDLDQQSIQSMVAWGKMPNLKQHVIDRGLTFSNSFVTNPVCCPSRATFLTGQYSHNNGVFRNTSPQGSVTSLNDQSTIATWLRNTAGYYTGHIGKYLNGYGTSDLNKDGTVDDKDKTYVPPGWDHWQGLVDPTTYRMYSYTINDHGKLVNYGIKASDYQTDVLRSRASSFINEANSSGKPFYLEVTPLAPHIEVTLKSFWQTIWEMTVRPAPRHVNAMASVPLPTPPAFNEADVTDKPQWLQDNWPLLTDKDKNDLTKKYRNRLESLLAVDDLIGGVVATLKQTGKYDNTIIIFTSDNGYMLGEHRLPEKLYAYEESIRVPLYVGIPGMTQNSIAAQYVINNDLAPTIAELAQATPDIEVDGTSFVPILGNNLIPWRKRFLVQHLQHTGKIDKVPTYWAVRTGQEADVPQQTYVEYIKDASGQVPKEHYDLYLDPNQLDSLHNDSLFSRVSERQVHSQWLNLLKSCHGLGCHASEFD